MTSKEVDGPIEKLMNASDNNGSEEQDVLADLPGSVALPERTGLADRGPEQSMKKNHARRVGLGDVSRSQSMRKQKGVSKMPALHGSMRPLGGSRGAEENKGVYEYAVGSIRQHGWCKRLFLSSDALELSRGEITVVEQLMLHGGHQAVGRLFRTLHELGPDESFETPLLREYFGDKLKAWSNTME
eukprot:COSAG04_NODE_10753_length_755_cov_1.320122_1_plen_185_part_01